MAPRVMTLVALVFGLLCLPVYSARLFDRRNDLASVGPTIALGFTVPLQAGHVCDDGNSCKSYTSSFLKIKGNGLNDVQVTTRYLPLPPTNHSRFSLSVVEPSTIVVRTPNPPTRQHSSNSILSSTMPHHSFLSWWTRKF